MFELDISCRDRFICNIFTILKKMLKLQLKVNTTQLNALNRIQKWISGFVLQHSVTSNCTLEFILNVALHIQVGDCCRCIDRLIRKSS